MVIQCSLAVPCKARTRLVLRDGRQVHASDGGNGESCQTYLLANGSPCSAKAGEPTTLSFSCATTVGMLSAIDEPTPT
jgi:hypothetical protein